MESIHLLYSYEEYKKRKEHLWSDVEPLVDTYEKIMRLSLKMDRTKEEDKELKVLQQKTKETSLLEVYTRSIYAITDKYMDLKDIHDDEKRNDIYNEIGRMQCDIEVLKEKWNNINND